MKKTSLAITLGIGTALAAIGPAKADLTINPNGNQGGYFATPETQVSGLPGFPLNLTGFSGGSSMPGYAPTNPGLVTPLGAANLIADVAGLYTFTFEGSGDSAFANSFSVVDSNGVTHTLSETGNIGNPPTTFTIPLNAGEINFTLTAGAPGTCTIHDSGSAGPGCNYLLALPNSSFGPSQTTAWIGFSDAALPTDRDFQDFVVRVDEVPEPASLALLGAALLGFAGFRRKANRIS